MKRILAVISAAVILAAPGALSARLAEPERRVLTWTNDARARNGLRAVDTGWRLRRAAEAHSLRMAEAGRIWHGGTWRFRDRRCFGQNVGVAPTLWGMFEAFMRSPAHRSNILNGCFRYAGIGVVRSAGYYWVTMNFASPP